MPEVVDDKSESCVPFILEQLERHKEAYASTGERAPPFFLGLNGVQGAGKTTLVETLKETFSSKEGLPTLVLSIDDLYLPHDVQEELAKAHPDNPLVQHRGQPSTHDLKLGRELFEALRKREPNIQIPSYDKSAFNGAGDRKPQTEWPTVNAHGEQPIEVIMFEGWCVGFRALNDDDVEKKWKAAMQDFDEKGDDYRGRLGKQELDSVHFINDCLKEYDELTDEFGAFIHIDAEDPLYVYDWRLDAEKKMRESKGSGMTPEQVVDFVNGYYPAYELYTDVLRDGIFEEKTNRQLRLVVGKDRKVKDVQYI